MAGKAILRMYVTGEELLRQELLEYMSEFVHIIYIQTECGMPDVDNEEDSRGFAAMTPYHIRLMNTGKQPVPGGSWAIYFNQANSLEERLVGDENLEVWQVDGWLYVLLLRPGQVLAPFSNVTMTNAVHIAARCYVFPRWCCIFCAIAVTMLGFICLPRRLKPSFIGFSVFAGLCFRKLWMIKKNLEGLVI